MAPAALPRLRLCIGPGAAAGQTLALPPDAARHAQVRRVQPGDALHVFDGAGHEWAATVQTMSRQQVWVQIGAALAPLPEPAWAVTLAVGMPANERMDALVEKATELGAAAIQPLQCERAVLRLDGERAQRRCAHWQAVATAAAEQCGRATVPVIGAVQTLAQWLAALPPCSPEAAAGAPRLLLSPGAHATPLRDWPLPPPGAAVMAVSGPEGGLTAAEEAAAQRAGFHAVGLGARVLRADTAPLALMAWFGVRG